MNLLIADDELFIRQGLLSLDWKSIGISEVYSASNGSEVRDLLISTQIDIAMLDIRMPGMSGLELAEMVREFSLDTAVILLTGFSDFEYARQALRSEVYEYILKPIRPAEILDTVSKVKTRLIEKRYRDWMASRAQAEQESSDTARQVRAQFSRVSPLVAEILDEMVRDYAQPLTLEEIAERKHFSQTHISRKIRQEAGYSFIEILRAIRLMNAARLLQQGERVNQACSQSGFRDQRYFSQTFRSVFGCSPREYKQRGGESARLFELLERVSTKKSGEGHED